MLAFLEDVGFQLILLIAAGVIWAISKVHGAAQQLRLRTRTKMDREEQRRKMHFEERSEYTAPEPAAMRTKPVLTAAPVRRPPRTKAKRRVVRRRVIRRTARQVEPVAVVADLRGMLRNTQRLRDAIVLREILGPPKALRGRRMR